MGRVQNTQCRRVCIGNVPFGVEIEQAVSHLFPKLFHEPRRAFVLERDGSEILTTKNRQEYGNEWRPFHELVVIVEFCGDGNDKVKENGHQGEK